MKMYHVAPVRMRDSILEYGINPSLAPATERWSIGDRPYAFMDLAEAEWYRDYNNDIPPLDDQLEIWVVEVEHPGTPDLGLTSDPDEITSAHQLDGPVPASATFLLV